MGDRPKRKSAFGRTRRIRVETGWRRQQDHSPERLVGCVGGGDADTGGSGTEGAECDATEPTGATAGMGAVTRILIIGNGISYEDGVNSHHFHKREKKISFRFAGEGCGDRMSPLGSFHVSPRPRSDKLCADLRRQ